MHNTTIAQRVSHVLLLSACVLTTAFAKAGQPEPTYLQKVSSPQGQTVISYNSDRTINKLVVLHKGENADYQEVIVPVYENGHIVKTLSGDDPGAAPADLNTTLEYNEAGKVTKISYYRSNDVYAWDSLAYNQSGQLTTRYLYTKQAGKNTWENSGYQTWTWENGNVTRQENFGKQPGYSKFIALSAISYRYDNKNNPQQQADLAWLTDFRPAQFSANNVVAETLTSMNASRAVTNTFVYTYNAGKFPVKATQTSDIDPVTVKMEWTRL
ncbi:hypothetical protein [Chitinophaga sp. Cy-1792]|uniref:hypothetical protein n=1 Tax=Chitinophaga sp. Cy-1792 TaxID=2608339 RepID=UPI001420C69B|nr:hypothetical protein [Chitinophaga sp. Cy-1792]NIG54271.1 hypothetical protein [Chitinophaga sp. Cy-1792]